jgi:hypothetical protein
VRSEFDRRVLPERVLSLLRDVQSRVPSHLAGGAALSAAHLAHRLSADLDLFCHERDAVRDLVRELPDVASAHGSRFEIVRDSGSFVRTVLRWPDAMLEVDLVHEALPDLEPAPPLEGILVESLIDLRAAKLTCLLSRSEPRDLVDLLFLDRAGFPPEADLPFALQKDAGIDPATLAWLLREFPVRPLPAMLVALEEDELRRFRDALAERFRSLAVPT